MTATNPDRYVFMALRLKKEGLVQKRTAQPQDQTRVDEIAANLNITPGPEDLKKITEALGKLA